MQTGILTVATTFEEPSTFQHRHTTMTGAHRD